MEESCSPRGKKSSNLTPEKSSPEKNRRLSPRKRATPSPGAKSQTSPHPAKRPSTSPCNLSFKEPITSPQERRKSLRRSSIKGVRHRKTLPPVYHNTTELSEAINLELPESDRLLHLLQSCFQFSAQKLEDSLKHTDGFNSQSFREKVPLVTKELQRFTERLSRDGTLQKCTKEPTSFPSNPAMEASKAQMREYIAKFSNECQSWDQLLLDYKGKAEEMSRQMEQTELTEAPAASVSHLGTSQDAVLHSKPDYNRILNEQGAVFDCMEIVLDELQESIQLLNSFLENTTQSLQKMSTRLQVRSFKQLEDSPVRKFLRIPQK